jgi:hypothetical protein
LRLNNTYTHIYIIIEIKGSWVLEEGLLVVSLVLVEGRHDVVANVGDHALLGLARPLVVFLLRFGPPLHCVRARATFTREFNVAAEDG